MWSWSDIKGFFFSCNRNLSKSEHLLKLNLVWCTRHFFSFLMWWTVIMNIRSFIMGKAASNSWRQPVNGYLSSGSSIAIDWIQEKMIYASTHNLSTASTLYHIGWVLCIWKVEKVIKCKKIYSPSVSEVKSEKLNIFKGTIGSSTWKGLKLLIQSGVLAYCFSFPFLLALLAQLLRASPMLPEQGF